MPDDRHYDAAADFLLFLFVMLLASGIILWGVFAIMPWLVGAP